MAGKKLLAVELFFFELARFGFLSFETTRPKLGPCLGLPGEVCGVRETAGLSLPHHGIQGLLGLPFLAMSGRMGDSRADL